MAQVIVSPETKGSGKLRVVAGTVALDGSNPTTVNFAGKFKTAIVAVGLSLNLGTTPTLSTSTLSWTSSGVVLSIFGWKPTGAGDTTLAASDGTQTVSYVAVGY